MNKIIAGALFVVATLAFLPAEAKNNHCKRCSQKLSHEQHKRIRQGVKNGELTGKEAAILQAQQAHIHRLKQMAMADGVVTPQEQHLLRKEIQKADANIHRQKHDCQHGR
ncbi:MAG: hypothetical protein JNK66_13695 [Chitinophagales bacterium]|nr:hypothetical protein [Chitinophagales bacterium]